MTQFKDLTGKNFGKLNVVKFSHMSEKHQAYFLCKCSCGNEKIIRGAYLTNGTTKSCGCLHKEVMRKIKEKHGMANSRMYRIWAAIIKRCTNKKDSSYKYYGKRGISVCDSWRYCFDNFMKWAYLNGYEDNLTIDRIDVNKGYFPENCRWVTMKYQNRNKRNNFMVNVNGKYMCFSELCELLKIPVQKAYNRMKYLKHKKVNEIFKGCKDLGKYSIKFLSNGEN